MEDLGEPLAAGLDLAEEPLPLALRRLRSVTSRKTRTAPTGSPDSSRIGAALSSTGRSVPSLAIRTVWSARPTTAPSRKARMRGPRPARGSAR